MKKIVLYFAGGTMRGVFGAGVAKAFEDADLYPRIRAVYGASAGVLTGAYFLARQTEFGASIYWDDLGSDFISRKDFFIGAWQRFQNRFVKKVPYDAYRDALNIEYLMRVVTGKKHLDVEKVISRDIPLNVKLFNLDARDVEYVDARRSDILAILKASVSAFPYVHEISIIDGKRYIDGAIMDIMGFEYLRKIHPDEKLVIVLNRHVDSKFRYRLKNAIEGTFMQWMFNDLALYNVYAAAEDRLGQDIEKIKADSNSLLIIPSKDVLVRSRTTDATLLLEMYTAGIETGSRVLQSSFMRS